MAEVELITRLFDVLAQDILPKTTQGVAAGNKIFGAAILRKDDLSLVLAETNNETENPLWHGEVHTLKRFYEMDTPPDTSDLIFLSTHEPCTMCISAITWAGFNTIYYYFSHEDSRDSFAIPHDLKIMQEIFGCAPGQYNRHNAFFDCYDLKQKALASDQAEGFTERMQAIDARYEQLSDAYQSGKSENNIPLS